MNKLFILFIIFILMPFLLLAQTGKIAGKITDAATGGNIEGAAVFLGDTETGTFTKENGTYILKDVPLGEQELYVRFIGYKEVKTTVVVEDDVTAVVNLQLEKSAVQISGYGVSANRAVARETPVSFTDIDQETIQEKYTTGDMPQMLDDIPGLFSTTSGIGEAEITMRGFDAQKIQILINGIPVNDPESQVVYWSNWTGLSSNVKSVQVQRGAGASMYGSGAFGGSVNIETMGSGNNSEFTIRTSTGYYTTDGKSATNDGVMEDYAPMNYNIMLKYSSGQIWNNKFKFDVNLERKAGDYYIRGTNYDGWSFGFETESKLGSHVLNTSFIAAPQKHNQARSTYDRELGKLLGREFNFTNHKWQENEYFKPQFSVRDRWSVSENSYLMTNVFVTMGEGGGSYADNITFDPETGALQYQPLIAENSERRRLADYAMYVYKQTGYLLDGFEINENNDNIGYYEWAGDTKTVIGGGSNTFLNDSDHTSKSTSYNNHKQFGLNSYYDTNVNENIKLIFGAEGRYWKADHYREGSNYRHYNPLDADSVSTFGNFLTEYDYTTTVMNTSGFARAKIKVPFDDFIQSVNFMLDGQYAIYYSEVDENLIHFFDPIRNEYIDAGYYSTKSDSAFTKDDYNRTYNFFSPKIGMNVNLNKNWNTLVNYSIVYKEPTVGDWYDRADGPGMNQADEFGNILYELEPEKCQTIEGGVGFRNDDHKVEVTYYYSKYSDKIESAEIGIGEQANSATLNVGKATHKGFELNMQNKLGNFDTNVSATFSSNRWDNLKDKYQTIFFEDVEDVEGKVVPFSPEKMASGGVGYTFNEMPLDGSLRVGLSVKWFDEYYTTYDNVYNKQLYYYDQDGNFQSYGECVFVPNQDGEGDFDMIDPDDPDNNLSDPYYFERNNGYGDYDREWIMRSSKLPEFFELNASLSYKFIIGGNDASIKLNFNNVLNKEDNFSKAYITRAFGMQLKRVDDEGNIVDWVSPTFGEGASSGNSDGSEYYPYLSPSPMFNVFLTLEYTF